MREMPADIVYIPPDRSMSKTNHVPADVRRLNLPGIREAWGHIVLPTIPPHGVTPAACARKQNIGLTVTEAAHKANISPAFSVR